jgi:predicted outer membrane protein
MQTSRYAAGTALVIGAGIVTGAALLYPAMVGLQTVSASSSVQVVSTQFGPLTADDRSFVVKVRLAGLWEFPAGQMGEQKGTTAAVKTAGEHLIKGHTDLDTTVRSIAPQLGITLPNQPTPQQQGFLTTLSAASGTDFDTKFANILRLTHGQIFTAIAKIRTTTKNTLVRQLADQANDTVLDHITVMEKTGLVNFDQIVIDETASPTINPNDTIAPSPNPGDPTVLVTPTATASLPPATSYPSS